MLRQSHVCIRIELYRDVSNQTECLQLGPGLPVLQSFFGLPTHSMQVAKFPQQSHICAIAIGHYPKHSLITAYVVACYSCLPLLPAHRQANCILWSTCNVINMRIVGLYRRVWYPYTCQVQCTCSRVDCCCAAQLIGAVRRTLLHKWLWSCEL